MEKQMRRSTAPNHFAWDLPDTPPMRILTCGMDPAMRRSLFLAGGVEMDLVSIDGEPVDVLTAGPVDAIVCDARNDAATALTLIERARKVTWSIPVVVLVSRIDLETASEAERLGARMVLRAPFTAGDICDAILVCAS